MSTAVMTINKSETRKMLFQGNWLVENTVEYGELIIRERARIAPPAGKTLTMIVNGIVKDIKPGIYSGRVILSVSEPYMVRPAGLMQFNQIACALSSGICVENGKYNAEKSIPEAVWGGEYDDHCADGVYMGANAEEFNGIVVDNSDYEIRNSRFDFEGFGCNDFAGADCGVTVLGKGNVSIKNSQFNFSGVTRCAIHTGGDSRMLVENCDITNFSPDSDWLGRFSWQITLRGTNRLCQLTDNGQVTYKNCRLKSNGWGMVSIDGSDEFVSLTLDHSKLELVGPRSHGYGIFNIGPNEVIVDASTIDVNGFPILMMGMEGKAHTVVRNGSHIKGRKFGAMIISDDNSVLDADHSDFTTGKASFFIKGSATTINLDSCTINPQNGLLVQLVDTDECGMDMVKYFVPVGVKDTPIEGRDLTCATARDDVIFNLSNMELEGDILNSTTNIRAYRTCIHDGMGEFHDTLVGPVGFVGPTGEGSDDMSPPAGHDPEELRGPKNLGIHLKNTRLTGVVSAATQCYREGVTEITPDNWEDLTDIRQTPAEPVNNGVVVSVDSESTWTVTGTSFLTSLTLENGAVLVAPEGRTLKMSVNGVDMSVRPGQYKGLVVLTVV